MTARTDPRRILLLTVVFALATIAGLWVGPGTESPSAEATPPTSLTVGLDMNTTAFSAGLYNIASLPALEACVDVDTNVDSGIFYLDVFILNVSDLISFNADLDFTTGKMQVMESSVNPFFGSGTITNLSKNASPALVGPAIDPPDVSGAFFAGALDTGGTHSGSGVLARLKAQAVIVPGGHIIDFQISTQTDKGVTLTDNQGAHPGDTTSDGIFDGPFMNAQGIIAVDRPDGDGDGASNDCDNCPNTQNADQKDTDADSLGDACDPDIDGDGFLNGADNCPTVYNPTQDEDACLDDDNDNVFNALDNCRNTPNTDQTDTDADGLGDACDPDIDGDGVINDEDNCPTVYNPTQDAACTDSDGDGVFDAFDNCPSIANTLQADSDGDSIGDICDPCEDDPNNDFDNDGYCAGSNYNMLTMLGGNDNCPFTANSDQDDTDADGLGNACDNCPAWPNADQSLPPWSVPAGDDDCDGWNISDENFMGTNSNLACGLAAWAPDFNDDNDVNVFDIDTIKPLLFTAAPGPPYLPRFDLTADGDINVFDIDRIKPLLFTNCTP